MNIWRCQISWIEIKTHWLKDEGLKGTLKTGRTLPGNIISGGNLPFAVDILLGFLMFSVWWTMVDSLNWKLRLEVYFSFGKASLQGYVGFRERIKFEIMDFSALLNLYSYIVICPNLRCGNSLPPQGAFLPLATWQQTTDWAYISSLATMGPGVVATGWSRFFILTLN